MKQFLPFIFFLFIHASGFAQCKTTTLNWDYLDFMPYSGNYLNDGYITSLAKVQTQHFAFGTQRLTITHNYAGNAFGGDNTLHSGELGSYGNGNGAKIDADVQFIGNGQIVLTFENEVSNLKFSMFDVDRGQKILFDARNMLNIPQLVNLTALGSSIATVLGTAATATAILPLSNIANTSVNAAFNIDILGPVKTLTILVTNTGVDGTNENGSFWLSDITGCTSESFPIDYYAVSRPYPGQPGYILHAFDESVYYVDPVTGITKILFTDVNGAGNINSLAYDPYNRVVYYVYSLTNLSTNPPSLGNSRVLKKYDFNTETISTVVADLNTIGIPSTTPNGFESGGASFYNGCLFLGVEVSNSARTSGREAVIYRVDLNASGIPYRASQVFALPNDSSGILMHDWADFVINDGILYDYDGAGVTTQTDIYHFDMMTGSAVNYHQPVGYTPGQPGLDWNGRIYNFYASGSIRPYIALYNGNGTQGARVNITSNPMFTPLSPSLGDAGDAFRPKADFGDAPATYETALAPAMHEYNPRLRLGATFDHEWDKTGATSQAIADSSDEDGLPQNYVLNQTGNYRTEVEVFNNTGANATLVAWIDFNGNGVFESGEGISQLVPSSNSLQTIPLFWSGIVNTLPNNSYTFLRIRITSSGNNLTTATPAGFVSDGEVEDHLVVVTNAPLVAEVKNFTAQKLNENEVKLSWSVQNEQTAIQYELERSNDGRTWNRLETFSVAKSNNATYGFTDRMPAKPASFYRLKYQGLDDKMHYSQTVRIQFSLLQKVEIRPNPSKGSAILYVTSLEKASAKLQVMDGSGRMISTEQVHLEKGTNVLPVKKISHLPAGLVTVQLLMQNEAITEKLIISKN